MKRMWLLRAGLLVALFFFGASAPALRAADPPPSAAAKEADKPKEEAQKEDGKKDAAVKMSESPPSAAAGGNAATDEALAAAIKKRYPTTIDDLRAIEHRVRDLTEKILPATVNVQIGPSQGSGVIVTADGFVLTAGHVTGKPGEKVILVLRDGRKINAKSLGVNHGIDSGMIQITDPGPWPFVEMSKEPLKAGQWCVSAGHPGGLVPGRQPVVRLGRILFANDQVVCTDCTLVGGDSGGPLFNLDGQVIGIHSRIGMQLTTNFHVPINTYRDTWDRLLASELWGGPGMGGGEGPHPLVGISGDPSATRPQIRQVFPGSPAEQAGIKAGDIVEQLDGKKVDSFQQLAQSIAGKKPREKVKFSVVRDGKNIDIEVTLGATPAPLPGGLPEKS